MKKIYCKNCKYYWYDPWFLRFYCEANKQHAKIIPSSHNFLEERKPFRQVWFANEINKNNDCKYYKYYKRKWWKFKD